MKICPVGAELFHADARKDSFDEANSRFWKLCKRALKSVNLGSWKAGIVVIVLLPIAMQDGLKLTKDIVKNETSGICSWNSTFLSSTGNHYHTARRSFAEDDILALTGVRNSNVTL